MENLKKQTPINLYLMVPHQVYERGKQITKICLLSCKKIKAFEGILPTKEILETHFQAEKVRIQISEKNPEGEVYRPQPLYLEVEQNVFEEIVKECRTTDSALGNPATLALSLTGSMPCCIISVQKKED